MADELHPLTELMLARMESHPEEFENGIEGQEPNRVYPTIQPRWWSAIDIIRDNGTEADKDAIAVALGKIRMDEGHRWAMDELMSGPERRERAQREEELARQQMYTANKALMQQMYTANKALMQQAPNPAMQGAQQYGTLNQALLGSGGQVTTTPASLRLGNETLSEGLISQIRGKLGL